MPDVPWWVRLRRRLRTVPLLHRTLARARAHFARTGFWLARQVLPARLSFGPPKGWFLIADEVRSGVRRGRIVLEQQSAPRRNEKSLRSLAPLGQQEQRPWPIFWSYHRDVRLVGPTLLVRESGKRIGVESAFGPRYVEDDPGYRSFRLPPPVPLAGCWTSIVSRWSDGFPHWFLDALPRLALLPEFPPDTCVIVPPRLTGFHRDTLNWLGLSDRIRPTSERHLEVEHYYFSSPTNWTGLFDPYAVEFARRSFLHRRDAAFAPPKKFFVHRVNAARGLVNEEEVLRFFRERDWPIIDTQTLTMAQQIQLFANAEHICALHGAALANLLWCPPGCRVLEIVASNFMNGVFEGIAEIVGLDYRFLLCPGDAAFKANVDLARLKQGLDD